MKKVKRFLPNPEKNWGPKVRAGRQITSKHVSIYGSNVLLNGDETGGEPLETNNGEPSAKRQKADNNGAATQS